MKASIETSFDMISQHSTERAAGKIPTFYLGNEAEKWDRPTIYNPSIEFQDQGRTVMLCRLEEQSDELSSESRLFEVCEDGSLELITDGPRFLQLQDPYYLGEFTDCDNPEGEPWKIIGGVKLTIDPKTGELKDWRDTYYRYKESIMELAESNDPVPFMTGAAHNKDMRFAQTGDGIAVFPRPQYAFGGDGQIGFFTTKDLSTLQQDLDAYFEAADDDTLISGIFQEGEWGGVNQVLPCLSDGTIVLVGHKASKTFAGSKKVLRYRPFVAHFDPQTRRLIGELYHPDVTPSDFGEFTPKPHDEADLADVLFTAGIMPHDDSSLAWLITGVADAVVGKIAIPHPLLHIR